MPGLDRSFHLGYPFTSLSDLLQILPSTPPLEKISPLPAAPKAVLVGPTR